MVSHNSLTALEKDFHGLPVLCMADLAHNNIKAINIQLALKSQCRIHGLNSTLRIYLQGKVYMSRVDWEKYELRFWKSSHLVRKMIEDASIQRRVFSRLMEQKYNAVGIDYFFQVQGQLILLSW